MGGESVHTLSPLDTTCLPFLTPPKPSSSQDESLRKMAKFMKGLVSSVFCLVSPCVICQEKSFSREKRVRDVSPVPAWGWCLLNLAVGLSARALGTFQSKLTPHDCPESEKRDLSLYTG